MAQAQAAIEFRYTRVHVAWLRLLLDHTDQDQPLQLDALTVAGCERIWTRTASGAAAERPRSWPTCCPTPEAGTQCWWCGVWTGWVVPAPPDRPVGRSGQRQVQFRSPTEALTPTGGAAGVQHLRPVARFERQLVQERTQAGLAAARLEARWGAANGDDPAKTRTARRMLDDGETLTAVAAALSVSRTHFVPAPRRRRGAGRITTSVARASPSGSVIHV